MIKGKIINFEWMCDYNHYDAADFDIISTKLIEKDLKLAAAEGYNTIFGIYLMDGFLHCADRTDDFLDQMRTLKTIADDLSLKIILVSGQGEEFPNVPFETMFFDYTLRMTYLGCKDHTNNLINLDQSKFLFLGGVSNRANRIGLLNRYYEADMLKHSEWSFFPPVSKDDISWCRNYLSKYSDEEYQTFIKIAERSFDEKFKKVLNYYSYYETEDTDYVWYDVAKTEYIKNLTLINLEIFKNTSFSVVSEGPNFWSDDWFFVTEKIWRTIFNKHAFILSGEPDQFRYLKKLGFKTFEEYMLIKDYAYEKDEETRLDLIKKNTEYFLKTIQQNKESITADINYNYQLFLEFSKQQDLFLENLITEFNVDRKEVDYFFNRKGYDHLIRGIPDGV